LFAEIDSVMFLVFFKVPLAKKLDCVVGCEIATRGLLALDADKPEALLIFQFFKKFLPKLILSNTDRRRKRTFIWSEILQLPIFNITEKLFLSKNLVIILSVKFEF